MTNGTHEPGPKPDAIDRYLAIDASLDDPDHGVSSIDLPSAADASTLARCDAAMSLAPELADSPELSWAFEEARQMARSGPGPAGHAARPWYLGPLPAWGVACAFALALALSTLPRAPQQPSSTESETQVTSFTFAPIVVSTDVLRTLAEADPVAVLANATAVDARSLAVLPFAGSSNANPAENATGIAESIYQQVVSQLRAVPGLYLIDAATAAFYSSSELSPQEMALQLGVRGIVEGRVDAVNGDIRFELRFTDAAIDGTSISEAIERPSEELALLQSDIASSVLGALTRPRQAFESDQTL